MMAEAAVARIEAKGRGCSSQMKAIIVAKVCLTVQANTLIMKHLKTWAFRHHTLAFCHHETSHGSPLSVLLVCARETILLC